MNIKRSTTENLLSIPNLSSASNAEVGLDFRLGACGARYLLETRARPDFSLAIDWTHRNQSIYKKNRVVKPNSRRAGSTEREGGTFKVGRCSPISRDARRLRHMNLLVNTDSINYYRVIYQEKLVLSTHSSSHTRHEKRPDLLPLDMASE
jgi:hypothetical protein